MAERTVKIASASGLHARPAGIARGYPRSRAPRNSPSAASITANAQASTSAAHQTAETMDAMQEQVTAIADIRPSSIHRAFHGDWSGGNPAATHALRTTSSSPTSRAARSIRTTS